MQRQLFEYHPKIGYRFIPDIKTRISHESGGYLLRTNNLGFRSEIPFHKDKKLDKKRILVFGDSFTAGDGVSNKNRYTDILSSSLGSEVEIYNFGMPATGTDQHFLIFQEYANSFEYDLVIIAIWVENIRRVNSQYRFFYDEKGERVCYQKPAFELVGEQLQLNNIPVQKEQIKYEDLEEKAQKTVYKASKFEWLRKKVTESKYKSTIQKLLKPQPVPEYNSKRKKEWILMRKVLENWMSQISTKVILLPIPMYQHIEELSSARQYQQRFAELSIESGAILCDPLDYFKSFEMEDRRSFRFPKDIHFTKRGHQVLAEYLVERIKLHL